MNTLSASFAISALLAVCQSLQLGENKPGALPILASQVNEIPGGQFAIDLSAQDKTLDRLRNLVQYSLDDIQASPGTSIPQHRLVRIQEANQQVVAGTNYHIIFSVGEEECGLRPGSQNQEPCRVKSTGAYGKCYALIYTRPWEHVVQVTEHRCVTIDKAAANQ